MSNLKLYHVLLAALITFGLTTNCFAGAYTSGRIIPADKVLIYSGDTPVGEYTEEAPLPLQSILTCSGDCTVRMSGLFARIKENTTFSIDDTSESRTLLVKEGGLFFALPTLKKQLVIVSSAGTITVQEAVLEAANQSDKFLRGYVRVTNERTEVGVIDGGALVVSTSSGQSTIKSGNRLVIYAQAQPNSISNDAELDGLMNEGSGALEEDDDDIFLPALFVGVVTGILADSGKGGEDPLEDIDASPKVP